MEQTDPAKIESTRQSSREGSNGKFPKTGRLRRGLYFIGGTIVGVVLIFWGLHYLVYSFAHEATDDAFIDGHIVAVAPKISGQVLAVHCVENQRVKQGDLLVEIDPRDYEMKLNQKRAGAQTAEANRETVRASYRLVLARVATAQASAEQARAEAEASAADAKRALADYERAKQLRDGNIISPQEFDAAQAAVNSAEASLNAAHQKTASEASKVAEAEAQVTAAKTLMATASAQLDQSQVEVKTADLDLSYTKIFASQDGQITRKAVEPGAYVQTGQMLFAIVPADFWVSANFKETQLAGIHPGQSVDIRVDAYPDKHYRGHVDSFQAGSGARFSLLPPENAVGNFVKVVQRVPVKILFDEPLDPSHPVGPGMSVVPSVQIRSLGVHPAVLAIVAVMIAFGAGHVVRRLVSRAGNQAG